MENGTRKTFGDIETNGFFCKPETFWVFKLKDWDVQILRRLEIIYENKKYISPLVFFLALQNIETVSWVKFPLLGKLENL